MPKESDYSQPRRSTRSYKTGEPGALDMGTGTRAQPRLSPPPPTNTDYDDDLYADEAYETPRQGTSAVRYPTTPHTLRTTAPQSTTSSMRRQTNPRNLSEQRQTGGYRDYDTPRQNTYREYDTPPRQNTTREYTTPRQNTSRDFTVPRQGRNSQQNTTRDQGVRTTQKNPPRERRRTHWFLPIGIGMIAMLALWLIGSTVVAWGTQLYNDVHYGYPRTFQTDAVVGHNNDSVVHPSHFVAINLNRQAVVIELMAGDAAKAVSYVAPVIIAGDGGDRAPITVEFKDVTRDNLKDMILHIHLPSRDQVSVYINDGKKFRPSTSSDKINF